MLRVGDRLPDFILPAVTQPGRPPRIVNGRSFSGKWLVLLYWPMDFGGICPSEVGELSRLSHVLDDPRVQVLGVGTELSRLRELDEIPFPIMADVRQELAQALGLAQRGGGCAVRATYLADPSHVVRWASTEDLSVAQRLGEIVSVLHTLRPRRDGSERPGADGDHQRSLIRMCAWCKKVHTGSGEWQTVELFVRSRTGEDFTHGICPGCFDLNTPARAR